MTSPNQADARGAVGDSIHVTYENRTGLIMQLISSAYSVQFPGEEGQRLIPYDTPHSIHRDEEPADDEPAEPEHRATYCPEDNKLRFYPDWDDPEFSKEQLKAAGFRWASKQECYVAPRWTPTAEDAALDYVADIEDETYGPAERAADRAERFTGYRDNRRRDAHSYADRMGGAVVGFQDQRKADRAARKRDRLAGHAVTQWDRAEYWQSRTAGVIAHAIGRENPATRRTRIKKLESEQRKWLASLERREKQLAQWQQIADWDGPEADEVVPLQADRCYLDREAANKVQAWAYSAAASGERLRYILPHPDEGANEYAAKLHGEHHRGFTSYELLTCESYGSYGAIQRLTPREVADLIIEHASDPNDADDTGQRWARHYEHRLAFERAMLAEEGGAADDAEIVAGGWINLRGEMGRWIAEEAPNGWSQILKVHKSRSTGKASSVEVLGTYGRHLAAEETQTRPVKVDITRFAADRYRAPTAEELEAFKESEKKRKAAERKNKPKAPPLINLTDEDAAALMAHLNAAYAESLAEYNSRRGYEAATYKPVKIVRCTQAQYSAASKGGDYAKAGTIYITKDGKQSRRKSSDCVFKVRQTYPSGHGFTGAPYAIIILTDKPQKPAPKGFFDSLIKAEATA